MLLTAAKPWYRVKSLNFSIWSPITVWKRESNGTIPFLEAYVKARGFRAEQFYTLLSLLVCIHSLELTVGDYYCVVSILN